MAVNGDNIVHGKTEKVDLVINKLTEQQYHDNIDDIRANHKNELFMTIDDEDDEDVDTCGETELWIFHLEDGTIVEKRMCIHTDETNVNSTPD